MPNVQLVLTFLLCISAVDAADHVVGGTRGWTETMVDYAEWAVGQIFVVGDKLIFNYDLIDDVVEVDKYGYDNCMVSGSTPPYTGGETTISLTSPGSRYFICSTSDHCWSGGMKLAIIVESSSPSASTMKSAIAVKSRSLSATITNHGGTVTQGPSPRPSPSRTSPSNIHPPSTPSRNPNPTPPPPNNLPENNLPSDIPPPPPSGGGVALSFGNQYILLIEFSLILTSLFGLWG